MNKRALQLLITVASILLIGVTINAQEITSTPYPPVSNFHWQAFPVDLYCEYVEGVAEGPSWGDITIGISNVEDLENYVSSIGHYEIHRYANFIEFVRSETNETSPRINACLDGETQIVTGLSISLEDKIYIQDLVAKFSIPENITWGNSNISRTIFWPNEGIAALVYILEDSENTDYGQIGLIVYFPYQTNEEFEEHWPYIYTNLENPRGGDRVYEPPPSEAQNPFDFEVMIATITAQPSRTPTPTFAPPSSTPTATPRP